MALLNRAQILAADDRRFEVVEVPEWGGSVRVGTMAAIDGERLAPLYSKIANGEEIDISVQASIVAACAVDEDGNSIFTAEDIKALSKRNANALRRVFEACNALNIATPRAIEAQRGN